MATFESEQNDQEDIPSFERAGDFISTYYPQGIQHLKAEGNLILIETNNGFQVEVMVLKSHLLRFRYAYLNPLSDYFSYATSPQFTIPESNPFSFEEDKEDLILHTEAINCHIAREDLRITILDNQERLINEDAAGFSVFQSVMKGLNKIRLIKNMQPGELFWGLGDKAGKQQLKGQTYENWNTDAYGYHTETDPLYTSVPFYMGLINGHAYGIFLDNSFKSYFDFDEKNKQVVLEAEGGEGCYYFIYGESLNEVAQTYIQLTGTPDLPPMWALGYHQCKWSYFPESKVMEIAATFRRLAIPCDSIYLDIDYMDGYRCFTWNKEHFPELKGMVQKLREDGFHTVAMIDPGIKLDKDYEVFRDGMKNQVFCRHVDGDLMIGHVWPGECVFPDYTHPKVRDWWGKWYHELYKETGISGFWNDMNEPAIFRVDHLTFPDTVVHHYEGRGGSHRKAHNIYGMQMTRASIEGLKKIQPRKRPFLLSRASFAGGQRYTALWTGDNVANWEHLAIANRQCVRLSICGFSFVGSDIGGFVDRPEGELYLRWIQLGVFHPFFRTHSMGYHTSGQEEVTDNTVQIKQDYDQEPWSFGEEITEKVKNSIGFRYQLLPFLYTAFYKYINNGDPVLKPLSFYDHKDPVAVKREREFLIGNQLLVSPVLIPGQKNQAVYLPKGKWYDFHRYQKIDGGVFSRVETSLDYIPVFAKAGSIIPGYPIRQHTGESIETLILKAFVEEGSFESMVYEDKGEGLEYKDGNYLQRKLTLDLDNKRLEIKQELSGQYTPEYEYCHLEIIGLEMEIKKCKVDGEYHLIQEKKDYWQLLVPSFFTSVEIMLG